MTNVSGSEIYLAIGSNLGTPLDNLRRGVQRIEALLGVSVQCSSPWLTTPLDCPAGSPPFANAALRFSRTPHLDPLALLDTCQRIEVELGREPKKVLNEARPLDLDIIDFGQLPLNSERLILPHPRAHERFFVLAPLVELCPQLVLPGHDKTVKEYFRACPTDFQAKRVSPFDWNS